MVKVALTETVMWYFQNYQFERFNRSIVHLSHRSVW